MAEGRDSLQMSGASVFDVFSTMQTDLPGLYERIMEAPDRPHRFVRIYVDDVDVTWKDIRNVTVQDKSTITVLAAVAGG